MIADKEGLVIRKLSETVTDFIENIGEGKRFAACNSNYKSDV